MRIRIDCPSCDHRFSVSAEYEGRRVKCPSCSEPVRVVNQESEDEEFEERPRRRSSERASRKSSKVRQSSSAALPIGLGIAGGVVALGLVIFFVSRPRAPQAVAQPAPTATPLPAVAASPAAAPPVAAGPVSPVLPAPNVTPIALAPTSPSATLPALPATTDVASRPASTETQPERKETAAAPPTVETAAAPLEPAHTSQLKLQGVPAPSAMKLDLPELIDRVEPAVVRINVVSSHGASTGSGFVVSKDGTVVTNYHVITDATRAEFEFKDGTKGNVLGFLHLVPESDIAIIKIDVSGDQLSPVPLSAELPRKGESMVAFGAPLGLSFTATKGIISAIRPEAELQSEMGLKYKGTWLQTDTSISPGNSGGPLVDHFGKVVGMNTFQSSIGQNLNFAVSSIEVIKALEAIKDNHDKITPLEPSKLQASDPRLQPDLASDEIDTERGRQLFAEVKEIFLINATRTSNFDPSGEIWTRVILRSQKAVEKSGIQLSYGEPPPDVAILYVYLEMAPSKQGTSGTQQLSVKAELTCIDPLAKKNQSPMAKVWKAEKNLGTISLMAAAQGQIPKGVDQKLADFFGGFRTAYNKAVKANTEAKNSADKSS